MKNAIVVLVLLAAFAGGVGGWYLSKPTLPSHPDLVLMPEPRPLPAFSMQTQADEAFSNDSFSGHWTLVFLGYTYCPDICPMTLANLSRAYPELKQQVPDLQVVLLTADPQRDSTERLRQYIAYFHQDFKAVRGEHNTLLPLTQALGLVYAMVDQPGDNNSYSVDHSASIVLVGPDGQLQARFRPDFKQGAVPVVDMALLKNTLPQLTQSL